MTEGERINLYNDLCDLEYELKQITFPPQTKNISIVHRAVVYVRGTRAKWVDNGNAVAILDENNRFLYLSGVQCSSCGFAGHSNYRFCPNCASKMSK